MKKLLLTAVTAGVLALLPGTARSQATANDQTLFGITFFQNQLIKIDPATGVGTLVMDIPRTESGYGLTSYQGGLYTFDPNTGTIDQLSPIDARIISSTPLSVTGLAGEGDLVLSDSGSGFLASAFDPSGAPTHPLYRFNVNTGVAVELGQIDVAIDGLALDNGTPQTLYALGQGDSMLADPATVDTELYTVNQVTGALTPVGPIGVPQNSPLAGLTFSPDGTLYAAIDDKLYTIDTATGAATIVKATTPDFSFSSVSGLAFGTGASVLGNLSSRAHVMGTGENVLISGFIVTAQDAATPPATGVTKEVILRGLGPSLTVAGKTLSGALANPTLSLRDSNGMEIAFNDNWKQNTAADRAIITDNGLAPSNSNESVIVANLPEGEYTLILQGAGGGQGLALVEVYDINGGNGLKLGNLSARATVAPGDQALISGLIVEGSVDKRALIRGLGPSLAGAVTTPLADPLLTAYDANGTVIGMNDNWMNSTQAADIVASGLAPSNRKEAVVDRVFTPGAYSIVLTGQGPNPTGTALIEVYDRNSSD